MAPILLVPQTGLLGGAERVLLAWSAALERPALIACPPGPLADAATRAGLEVVPVRERSLRGGARGAARLAGRAQEIARLARRHRPAVVVASGLRPALAATAAPLGGAALVTVHHDLFSGRAVRAALRASVARSAAAVATSNAVAEAIGGARNAAPASASNAAAAPANASDAATAPASASNTATAPANASDAATAPDAAAVTERIGGVHVIHPGVDRGHWALPDAPPGPPRALLLGALVPVKRVDLALEIAARVPELTLDVAGARLPGDPPGYVDALTARAARPDLAGRVRFLGAVEDPRPVLAQAHCLLHCADREAFGLALVEALTAGRPVVAPAAGGPLEIVTRECGRLYRPGDAASGAVALREVLGDDRLRAGARARSAAFDGTEAARRFAALIDAVAS